MRRVTAACLAATVLVGVALALAGTAAHAFDLPPPLRAGRGPLRFPLYKQCDPRWGKDEMGVKGPGERSTICGEGCAMTSTAMMLASFGVKLDGALVTPKSLNKWLMANHGYVCAGGDCNNERLPAINDLTNTARFIGENPKGPFDRIMADIATGAVVHLAHVRNRTHFVLLTGRDPQSRERFTVNDPFYNSTSYAYGDIADIIRFKHVPYPLYKQCDSRWGGNVMGSDGETICQVGCLMSSTSMALHGSGISIPGQGAADPQTLNAWLRANHGYVDGSCMDEAVVPKIAPGRVAWPKDGMHTKNDIPLATVKEYLDRAVPRIVIANVMHGQHFVLVVGYEGGHSDALYVNDPGFNRLTYNYSSDVVGWRIFDMK